MSFVVRHEEIIKKTKSHSNFSLWFNTVFFGIVVLVSSAVYLFFQEGYYDILVVNRALANTALFLIGASLALSAVCYFWDFLDTKIVYRKHLGIIGFSFGAAHLILVVFFIDAFHKPEVVNAYFFSIVSAWTAVVIFSVMTLISNRYAVHELGGKIWRQLLRYGGYTAFLFVTIHFSLLKIDEWLFWLTVPGVGLPPLSFVTIVFVVLVFLLRIVLAVALSLKRRKNDV